MELAANIRRAKLRLLKMHFESRVGHIGGNLSCLDLLMTLHVSVMAPGDTFILSKGHAAGALYITLWAMGRLSEADLSTFHHDASHLSGHPAPNWHPDIPFATGSLGHGLGLACGMALAKRLKGEAGRIYCLLSDGEWQEGSNWESLIFLAHRALPVTLLIDANGLQGFGATDEVASMGDLERKLGAFGIPLLVIDGHDPAAIESACNSAGDGPQIVFARTCKGRGVAYMENRMEWHYLPMTEEQYLQAMRDVEAP